MFVETVEIIQEDHDSVAAIKVLMGDKRIFEFKEKVHTKGYCLVIRVGHKLQLLLTDCPRVEKYDREWLDSLEFKLLLEGQDVQLIYGGTWLMQAYSMFRFKDQPQALKWLVSINRLESTFSTYSIDCDVVPDFSKLSVSGKRMVEAMRLFDATRLKQFLERCHAKYSIGSYTGNYRGSL